jgi:hypothetical protein
MATTNNIENEQIDGAFALSVDVRFDDLSATRQKVFDYSDAAGSSRIILGQRENSNDLEFGIVQDGKVYLIYVEDILKEGVMQTFRVGIDPDGVMRVVIGDEVVAEGQGVVPHDVERDLSQVGLSPKQSDDDMAGVVADLSLANYTTLADLANATGPSPCDVTGEASCPCAKLAGAAEINLGEREADPYSTVDTEGDGEFSGVQALAVIPIHSMVLPDGKVLSFGATASFPPDGRFVYSLFDPETGVEKVLANTTEVNIFCSHMALDPLTGNVIIMGGDNVYVEGGGFEEDGVHDVLIFDYRTETIEQAPEGNLEFGRYYGTTANLSNGEIVIVGGIDSGYLGATFAEVYSSQTGIRTLTNAEMPEFDDAYTGGDWYYPHVFVTSDDRVLVIEANGNEMYWMTTDGTGTVEKIGDIGFHAHQLSASLMFGTDQIAILGADGGIYVADISQDVPVFDRVAELDQARTNAGLVQMPDGRIAIVGGNIANASINPANGLDGAIKNIEIWDPATNTVELLDEGNAVARMYHSSSTLLPDGTIWTGGGGAPGPIANSNVEIYAPDYLYGDDGTLADRPVITSAPSNIDAGDTFTIQVDDASAIDRITAIKPGAYTHARNSDARFFELEFTVLNATTISVSTPPDAGMLPGAYMLFALDANGTPSASSMLGVDTVDLVETPNFTQEDGALQVYNIDNEDIDGAFSLTVEVRFDDLTDERQKIFDTKSVDGDESRILLGQINQTSDIEFVIIQDGAVYRLTGQGAIVEGEFATWTVSVNTNGMMSLSKDGTVLATGQGVVPNDVERALYFTGESTSITDDRLKGVVRNLEITNEGDAESVQKLSFEGSVYQRGTEGLTYEQALAEAEALGGKLLEVDSQAESDFITALFNDGKNPIWLGITDVAEEGVWRNADGSGISYSNWLPGQPNNENGLNGGQNYAAIVTADGQWDDFFNTNSAFFNGSNFVPATTQTIIEFDKTDGTPDSFGNSSYVLGTQGLTWLEAQAEAEAMGGKLVEINSQAENDFIVQNFGDGQNSIHVGFSDAANEGVWVGSNGQAAPYTNWLPGQPDNAGGNQDYARIASASGQWDDGFSQTTFFFNAAQNTWSASSTISVIEFEDAFIFGDSRYELGTQGLTWLEAQAEAEAKGGRVVEINSAAENDYIVQTLGDGQNSIWIGFNDTGQEGVWRDSDGAEIAYTNWMVGQPDNAGGNQDYARIAANTGEWDDGGNGTTFYQANYDPSNPHSGWQVSDAILVIEYDLM